MTTAYFCDETIVRAEPLGMTVLYMILIFYVCAIDLVRQRSPSDGSGSELRYWVGFFGVVSLPLKTAFGTIGNCHLRSH